MIVEVVPEGEDEGAKMRVASVRSDARPEAPKFEPIVDDDDDEDDVEDEGDDETEDSDNGDQDDDEGRRARSAAVARWPRPQQGPPAGRGRRKRIPTMEMTTATEMKTPPMMRTATMARTNRAAVAVAAVDVGVTGSGRTMVRRRTTMTKAVPPMMANPKLR